MTQDLNLTWQAKSHMKQIMHYLPTKASKTSTSRSHKPTCDMTNSLTSSGSFCMLSTIYWEPMLEVMIRMAFLNETMRPWLSVTLPSSSICSRMLKTSAWAFSISSNKTTAYGRRLHGNKLAEFAVACLLASHRPCSLFGHFPGQNCLKLTTARGASMDHFMN